jgi:transposase
MLSIDEQQLITELFKSGESARGIARRLGRSMGTIYKYQHGIAGEVKQKSNDDVLFEPTHQQFIEQKIRAGVKNSTKLFNEIQAQGYTGSYARVNKYVRENTHSVRYKQAIRVETHPGEQAQVDWGTFRTIMIDGRREKLHAFVYISSYSRMLYVEFTIHQNQQVLQRAHIHAFEALGVPKLIRYDNMKTVVISHKRADDGSPIIKYNPAFLDFAKYYNFTVEACPPYWPRAKGKVESSVKYVRNNFMDGLKSGRSFRSIDDINRLVRIWLDEVVNVRIHRTINRRPVDAWEDEKKKLRSISNIPRYNASPVTTRRSTKDALVQYKYNLYSVPSHLARKALYLREVETSGHQYIEIYYKNELQVRHKVSQERGKWIMDAGQQLDNNVSVSKPVHKTIERKNPAFIPQQRELSYYNQMIPTKGGQDGKS